MTTTMATSRRSTTSRSRAPSSESKDGQKYFPDLSSNDIEHIYLCLYTTLSTPQVSLFGPPHGGIPLVKTTYTHAKAHIEDPTQYVLFRYLRALINTSTPHLELYYYLIDSFISTKKLGDTETMRKIQGEIVEATVRLLGMEPGLTVWDHGMRSGLGKEGYPEHLGRKWGKYGDWKNVLGVEGFEEQEWEVVFRRKVEGVACELGIVIS